MADSCRFAVFIACLYLAEFSPAVAILTKTDTSVKPLTVDMQGNMQAKREEKIESLVVSEAALVAPVWPLQFVNSLINIRALRAYLPKQEQLQHLPVVSSLMQQITKVDVHQPTPQYGPHGRDGASIQDPEVTIAIQEAFMRNVAFTFFSALCFAGFVLLVAYWYNNEKKFPPACDEEATITLEDGAFKYGLCSCFDDLKLCALSFCCSPIRWADTIRMMGFMQFWPALGLYLGLSVLDTVVMGWAGLVLVAVCIYYRQKLRERFGMPHGSCGSIFGDCLTYLCCSCCAIIQEARQVEDAWRTKHPAVSNIDV